MNEIFEYVVDMQGVVEASVSTSAIPFSSPPTACSERFCPRADRTSSHFNNALSVPVTIQTINSAKKPLECTGS